MSFLRADRNRKPIEKAILYHKHSLPGDLCIIIHIALIHFCVNILRSMNEYQ